MRAYIKALGLHVFLTTIKKSYLDNDKLIEANTQALYVLKHTLGNEHIFLISHCDFAFTV